MSANTTKLTSILQVFLLSLSVQVIVFTVFHVWRRSDALGVLTYTPDLKDILTHLLISLLICLVYFLRRSLWFKLLLLVAIAINFTPVLSLSDYFYSGAWQRVAFSQYSGPVKPDSMFLLAALIHLVLFALVYSATAFMVDRRKRF